MVRAPEIALAREVDGRVTFFSRTARRPSSTAWEALASTVRISRADSNFPYRARR